MEVFTMFEIIINGNLVCVAIEEVVKLFVSALVDTLPIEMNILVRRHEPQTDISEVQTVQAI
jgi:phosphopantothenate synthetase